MQEVRLVGGSLEQLHGPMGKTWIEGAQPVSQSLCGLRSFEWALFGWLCLSIIIITSLLMIYIRHSIIVKHSFVVVFSQSHIGSGLNWAEGFTSLWLPETTYKAPESSFTQGVLIFSTRLQCNHGHLWSHWCAKLSTKQLTTTLSLALY